MLKIGEHEVTLKHFILAGILILVAFVSVYAMIGKAPKPKISQPPPPSASGLVLMQGGQPGGGPGQFNYPRGVAVDSHNDIYVADSKNHRIQKFSGKDWQMLDQFGGLVNMGGADPKRLQNESLGKLNEPNGIAVGPDDMIYVIDTWNGRIQVFNTKGKCKKAIASDDGFFGPRELTVDSDGFIYVADTGKHRIVKFDKTGKKVRAWGIKGSKPGEFNEPIGLALDQGKNLYVADRLNFRIQVFNSDGQFIKEWPVKGWVPEQVDMEPHLALDQAHSLLYATDGRSKRIFCFKLDGTLVNTIEKDMNGNNLFMVPLGVAVDKDGNVYMTDASAGKLYKLKGQF
jgi:tripartite motif-containing protein 71